MVATVIPAGVYGLRIPAGGQPIPASVNPDVAVGTPTAKLTCKPFGDAKILLFLFCEVFPELSRALNSFYHAQQAYQM